jgi:hypothetical protein
MIKPEDARLVDRDDAWVIVFRRANSTGVALTSNISLYSVATDMARHYKRELGHTVFGIMTESELIAAVRLPEGPR